MMNAIGRTAVINRPARISAISLSVVHRGQAAVVVVALADLVDRIGGFSRRLPVLVQKLTQHFYASVLHIAMVGLILVVEDIRVRVAAGSWWPV